MDDFMKDVKITVIREEEPVVKNGMTYDVEIWLFDHGKKGTAKIIKHIPRPTCEQTRRKNRENIQHAVNNMYKGNLCRSA